MITGQPARPYNFERQPCTTHNLPLKARSTCRQEKSPTDTYDRVRAPTCMVQLKAAPRIQTFAWRLIRRALPTGERAGKYSKYISTLCARCGLKQDDLHILFNCPFSRAAWFARPWYIRTDLLIQSSNSLTTIILNLANSNHPHATLSNIFTFMWCLWKARNEKLFQRKDNSPFQVFFAAQAITRSLDLELGEVDEQGKSTTEDHKRSSQAEGNLIQGSTIDSARLTTPVKIFTDAAWQEQGNDNKTGIRGTGIGILLQVQQGDQRMEEKNSATAPYAQSAIHAEAHGINLAAIIMNLLNIQQATILTDNLTLATAAAARSPFSQPGHWQIRSTLTDFCNNTATKQVQVFHVTRTHNCEAHAAARIAGSQELFPDQEHMISCCNVEHQKWQCPLIQIIPDANHRGYVITHVNCI